MITCQPIDAAGGLPAYTAQNSRQAFSALLFNGTNRAVGSQSGFVPGRTPNVTASTSAWYVSAGVLVIDPAFTTNQGPYLVSSDATVTGAMTAASASVARTDAIDLRVDDNAIDSSGARQGVFVYTAGNATSGAVPVLAARSFRVATIIVPISGGGSPTVLMSQQFAVAAGGILPVASNTTRDALIPNPYPGMKVYRLDTKAEETYSTSGWVSRPPAPPSACRYYCNAAMNITNNGRTAITLGGMSFDYSPTSSPNLVVNNTFTAPEAGLYDVRWRVSIAMNNNPQDFHSLIATAGFGAELSRGSRAVFRNIASADAAASVGADLIPLAAGGQLILAANNGGANACAVSIVSPQETWLSVVKAG